MDNSTFNDSSVGYPDSSSPSVSDAGGGDGDDANLTFVIEGVILSAVCVTGFAGKNHVIEAEGMYEFPDYQADARDPEIARLVMDIGGASAPMK